MKKVLSIILSVIMVCSCMMISADAAYFKKLDIVFVIDTTSSMIDCLDRMQADMTTYIDALESSRKDYRMAIVDYRDFAERTESERDYPYKVELDFTESVWDMLESIRALDLGYGGDGPETICSALIDGLDQLSWREDAAKVAILVGDAPALDPEPVTGYTKNAAVNHLRYGTETDPRSHIQLFTIAVVSDYIREADNSEEMMAWINKDFTYLADGTGGKTFIADDEWDVTDNILRIIDNLEEWVVSPEDPIQTEKEKRLEGIWSTILAIAVAPYAFLYMVIAKVTDSASANFDKLLALLERIFVK